MTQQPKSLKEQQGAWGLRLNSMAIDEPNEIIELSSGLDQNYPNLYLELTKEGIQAFCQIDKKRCLNPINREDDFEIISVASGRKRIMQTFSPFCLKGCENCLRNPNRKE